MGVGLQLCPIDGGDSLQVDLLLAASAHGGNALRPPRGGRGGSDRGFYCIIKKRGPPELGGRPEMGSEKRVATCHKALQGFCLLCKVWELSGYKIKNL